MEKPKPEVFIGLDMVDGCRPNPRKVDVAFLDRSLACTFDTWTFNEKGVGLFPGQLRPPRFVLAIDGPQGLAASPADTMRQCEREGGVAGKSPYGFPSEGMPFGGFIISSVRLFASLWKSGRFHFYGFPEAPTHQATLIEVYPGKAWRDLAEAKGLPLTEKKTRRKGREQRRDLLKAVGLTLALDSLPSHDQLDAALAAFIAFLLPEGKTTQQGTPPKWDGSSNVLREGFIIYPDPSKL